MTKHLFRPNCRGRLIVKKMVNSKVGQLRSELYTECENVSISRALNQNGKLGASLSSLPIAI